MDNPKINIFHKESDKEEDIELKPCPFCGSSATVWYRMDNSCTIECDNEYCGCVYGDSRSLSFDEACDGWNSRI